jgi:hypothetical protein
MSDKVWFAQWTGSQWERKPTHCPTAIEPPKDIPAPLYRLSQMVRFDWAGPIGQGKVERIECWSGDTEPFYYVVWLGHIRAVRQRTIIRETL